MINQKWLDLLSYLQQKTHTFAGENELKDLLESKLMFLKTQFSNISQKEDPRQQDWLEHEAVTAVLTEQMARESFSHDEVSTLFNILSSAKLSQLALIVINSNSDVLAEDDYALKYGQVLLQMGEQDQALASLEKACEINPDNYMAFFHCGFAQIYSGNMEKAEELFKACIEKEPSFVGGYQNLAGCYYQRSEFKLAAECCEQVYEINQTTISCYITAISCHIALKNIEQAQLWLDRAASNSMDSLELVRLGGMVAYESGDNKTAIEQLTTFLESSDEPHFDVLWVRAKALAAEGLWEQLIPDLEALLDIDPFDTSSLESLFMANYHLKNWQKAEQVMMELGKSSEHFFHKYKTQLEDIRKQHAEPIRILENTEA